MPARVDRSAVARAVVPGAVVVAVLVGIVARFLTTSPLWLDEALSVNIASLPLGDITEALRRDGHPPLYYWLLHGWMSLFGDGDVAVRSLSGVLSVATLPLAWRAGHDLAGRAGAAWALVLLALSPFAIRYGTEARMYALVMFLVLAGYLALREVLRAPSWRSGALLAVVTGALLWTHYWGLYLGAATALVVAIDCVRSPDTRKQSMAVLAALAAGAALLLPWVPSMLEQAAHTGTPWGAPARPTVILASTLTDLGGGALAEAQLVGMAIVILLVVAAFGRADPGGGVLLGGTVDRTLRREITVVGATLLVGTAAGYASGGAFATRYASVVVPLILLVAAVGMAQLHGWIRVGVAAVVLGGSLVGLGHNVTYARTQADDLAAAIVAGAGPGDVVVACPDQLGPSLARALEQDGAHIPVVPYPLAGDARFVDWRDYAERNARADPAAFADAVLEQAGPGGIWVVWHGAYRTLSAQCEALVGHLGASRAGTVVATASDAFEPGSLYHFP